MSRWRLVTGVGVVAALAGALILLSLQPGGDPVSTSTSAATSLVASTTEPVEVTTTAEPAFTTTTSEEERRAEVEDLLRDLWFGWFDAIYRKDRDALWQVVATTRNHEAGITAMETMEFTAPPSHEGVDLRQVDILLDRPDCLVVLQEVDTSSFRGEVGIFDTVSVMWPDQRYGFRFATAWALPGDLWVQDCDNLTREPTP